MSQTLQKPNFQNIVRSTVFLVWFAMRGLSAQPHESYCNELLLTNQSFPAGRCVLLSAKSPLMITLAFYTSGEKEVAIGEYDVLTRETRYSFHTFPFSIDTLVPFCFDTTRVGIVASIINEKKLAIFTDLKDEKLQPHQIIDLPFTQEMITAADFNNDTRCDLMVCNFQEPGIMLFLSTNDGTLRQTQTLLPNTMVRTIAPIFLNNDPLIDLLVYDWVKSEFHVLYGVGKARFLDQSLFHAPEDIQEIVSSKKYYHMRIVAIAALLKEIPAVQIWIGNELGDIQLEQTLTFSTMSVGCFFVDLDGDGNDELVVIDSSLSLSIFSMEANGEFILRCKYGLPMPLYSVVATEARENIYGTIDVLSKDVFLSYLRNTYRTFLPDTLFFPLERFPGSMITTDFNQDGISDVCIAHEPERVLSFIYGSKFQTPHVTSRTSLSNNPSTIKYFSSTDSTVQIIVTYPKTKTISVIILDNDGGMHEIIIPTEGIPTLIAPVKTYPFIALLNETKNEELASISLYEAFGNETFIERTFRLSPPNKLLGADVSDVNGDELLDILYVYRSSDSTSSNIGIAFGDSSLSISQQTVLTELSLPESNRYFLWNNDIDRNDTTDVILFIGEPWNQLWCFRGDRSGMLTQPHFIAYDVKLKNRSQLVLADCDEDGLTDIIIAYPQRGIVEYYREQAPFEFAKADTVLSENGIGSIAAGDIDGDGYQELLATFPKNNYLEIINGQVWLRKK